LPLLPRRYNNKFRKLKFNILRKYPLLYNKPSKIFLKVTERCNSRCTTCLQWQSNESKDIEQSDILKFIDDITNWLGPREIIVSGGEPLLREDIFEIISYIRQKGGFPWLLTNAISLNAEKVDKLAKSGLSIIAISLNSVKGSFHDNSRGIKDNKQNIKTLIEYILMKYHEITLIINFTITSRNIEEISHIAEYAYNRKIVVNYHLYQKTFCSANAETHLRIQSTNTLRKNIQNIKRYKDAIPQFSIIEYYPHLIEQRPTMRNCDMGYANLILNNNSTIKFCRYGKEFKHDRFIKDIWYSKSANEEKLRMLHCNHPCYEFTTYKPTWSDIIQRICWSIK
jgi:MoaA/NifB/PqqE/SkfB family radical SAM enzyme